MMKNRLSGYLWMTFGMFFLIFFGGRLFLQLMGVLVGVSCILKGLRILMIDQAVYSYSRQYFDDQFLRK